MTNDFKKYKEEVLDSKSTSFCGAKWFNATTWLGSGTTASCHHPPAHKIPLIEIETDYTAIHNTKHKKEMRRQMQTGKRPSECEYCWKMEDMETDAVSDRVFKSVIYSDSELQRAFDLNHHENVNLKTFEIAFDRTCNLACSYCNASFSTTWAKDINNNGPYENLVSDGAGAFKQDGSHTQLYDNDDDNPYIQAFWKWWDNGLSDSLDELRITGGEPLMSGNTWKLFDWFEKQNSNMGFAINSNLIAKASIIDKLVSKAKNINNFSILRFPSFQSPLALPVHLKDYCYNNLNDWYQKNKDREYWMPHEKASIERLIDYLITVDAPHRRTSNPVTLWRDFKTFYQQYDIRRNKDINVFPKILTDWIESIPDTDSSIMELAENEGWVLNPEWANIKDPLGTYDNENT